EALAERGHDVRLAAYAGGERLACRVPIRRIPSLPGAGRLRSGPSLAKPLLDGALLFTVRRLAREFRPDVIHAHNFEGAAVALVSGAAPVVYHAHGLLSAELPVYLPQLFSTASRLLGAAVDRSLPRRAAATVALTGAAARALVAAGAPARRVHVIPPGIAVTAVDVAASAALRARFVGPAESLLVYAGNADAYQEIGTLLDVAAMPGSPTEARYVFALTGGARDLPAAARARGLEGRVHFLDSDWEETAQLLAACDAAVVPRSDPHGFPMKLLNVLALGAPAIVHRGCAHGLEDGVNALVADGAEGFARALGRVLDDRAGARRIGEAGRRHARKHHAWDDLAPRLEAVLADAAAAG
ncbi:MAG: glycosyltransferase, partial [Deltaproteobacteria bacterium]|nr:glycosyltransferase [Deltaproteobacteria bacterium]